VERLVVGLVELVITIYRGTVVRLTAVGDAIVSLGRRITHRLRRQPSEGSQVFIDRDRDRDCWLAARQEEGE
jgi:hypothetical protein